MKILIADDDAVARRLLEALLKKWGYDVLVAGDGAEALAVLQRPEPPPLAILDWMMPAVDGVEVCRRVRERTGEPYIYVFLLTAKDGKAAMVHGLEAGADDYLTKPFDQAELQVRLRAATRVLDLQAALIAARERLRDQATHDGLTGLWNRPAILEELERELARDRRQGTATTVVMADLDHFKRINDTYGHLAGDEVLREIASRMRASVRKYDSVGRYGGEEFLIVAPGCDTECARGLTEGIRGQIADAPVTFGGCLLPVTISMGAATLHGGLSGAAALIQTADEALYGAKRNGRNRTEFAFARAEAAQPSLGGSRS